MNRKEGLCRPHTRTPLRTLGQTPVYQTIQTPILLALDIPAKSPLMDS